MSTKKQIVDYVTHTPENVNSNVLSSMLDNFKGSGTSDYNELTNKPQINGIELSENKSLIDLGIASIEEVSKKAEQEYVENKITELQQEIETVSKLVLEVVDELPTASADTMDKIYLIPCEEPGSQDSKDEYITVRAGDEGAYTYTWEKIGNTKVDLSQYYKKDETDTLLDEKQDKLTAGTGISIDENNVISATGGASSADWNAKEGEDGFIANKPFGVETEEIILENLELEWDSDYETYEYENHEKAIFSEEDIGKKVIINYNDESYSGFVEKNQNF